ncbi:discoidin domain-containing protein [Ignavibacterium sp.]|uniref:discoidin domain-containing protein n=1 Tax=Ignavibacterium sp. TaxID=2651167 RepID=UPI0021FAAD72|nr:discoidin domain-containing protein [Ignavibacterium sp.]BDQ02789.1 MAG: hypothetical protein KatS3mg037_1364 [Ignavibacterium sp.]
MSQLYSGWFKSFFQKTILLIILLSFSLFAQNRWYLSPTGSGNQDGLSRANARFYTNHGTLNIQPGDTVYFVEGYYTQQLDWLKSGAPGALITLMPDPANTGEVVFSNPNDYAIKITGRSYLRLYKLKIRNSLGGVRVGQGKVKYLDSLDIRKSANTGINIYGKVSTTGSFVYDPNYDPGLHSNVDSVFIRWCYVATDTQVTAQTDVITGYWMHGVRIIGNYLFQGNYTGDGHNDCIQLGHGLGDVYITNNVLINLKQASSQIFMNGNSWGGYKTVIYNNVAIHYGAGVGMWQTYAYNGLNPNGGIADIKRDGEVYLINNTMVGKRYLFMMTTLPDTVTGKQLDSLYAVNNIFYHIQSDGSRALGVPRKATESYNAMYIDNNIHAIVGGGSIKHIEAWYGNTPQGNWTLSEWNNLSSMKMLGSTTSSPTFQNLQYNANLYWEEDLRLTSGSVGINAGRNDIKIKGNQWVNLKTLVESFGLEWKGFDNPYVSWSNPVPRSETAPTIGAWEFPGGSSGNLPPNAPSNPNPSNGASGQATSLTLTWSCTDPDGDPLTYDIYFGTNNNPPLAAQNLTNTNFVQNNLNAATTYYWRIVARDNQGATRSGSVWSFTTASTDTIAPRLVSATLIDNITLSLTFSENLNPASVNNTGNYIINNGIQVNSVLLNGSNIRLSTTPHSPGFYNVTVNNVTDMSGNLINSSFNSVSYGYNPDTLLTMVKFTPFNSDASSAPDTNLNPYKTFDGLTANSGDPTTRWAAPGLPQWIGYDLGDTKILNKTRVQFFRYAERTYQYSIQVSVDSVNWTEVRTNVSSLQGAEWDEQILDAVPARYIRIIVLNNSAQNNWASIWETEFYGQLMVSNNEYNDKVPTEFVLEQNYPNPFNPTTKIRFSLPASSLNPFSKGEGTLISLKVYDLLGNEVATLVNEYKQPGVYEVEFDASDLSSGVYIYRLQADAFVNTRKMVLLR